MTKTEKLKAFLKTPPKGWADLDRKTKLAAASKASGMTPGSLGVAISTRPELRPAFGLPKTPLKRRARPTTATKGHRKGLVPSGVVLAATNAIDLMTLDQLIDTSRHLRRALSKKMEAARKEIRAYKA